MKFLVTLILSWSAAVFANGEHAIRYHTQRAQLRAESVDSPAQFRQSAIDDYEFYQTFVGYGGFRFLSRELLASWEFADRIENLNPYWSPFDAQAIHQVRQEAALAREALGVDYPGMNLAPDLVAWWQTQALENLERMKRGEQVKLLDLPLHIRRLFVSGIQHANISMKYNWQQGRFADIEGESVWVQDRFEAEGRITQASIQVHLLGSILISSDRLIRTHYDGVVARGRPGHSTAVPYEWAYTAFKAESRLNDARRLSKALRLDLFPRLLAGESVPNPFLSTREFEKFRDICAYSGFAIVREHDRLHINNLYDLIGSIHGTIHREKGVRPCERQLTQ